MRLKPLYKYIYLAVARKENTACAKPLATAQTDVALILLLRKLYFLLGQKNREGDSLLYFCIACGKIL
ncbi:hypothetical protein SPSPH_046120 [Sporomusa sphaeroides DSM 2875]|uniref:Uncharacterized protein n=1 Tax=Sporomusa sphaeroides DSM 2875 TaxID=1337886 RepID=A0ABP2C597_9FIRM|nr:hypothetical protein SPSPH_28380 [Sporomusa sphaeroides DSM 2875]CVK18534.1 hypothetical protein SSPH_01178 [Sporomusa sphaeroides DSM 2875]